MIFKTLKLWTLKACSFTETRKKNTRNITVWILRSPYSPTRHLKNQWRVGCGHKQAWDSVSLGVFVKGLDAATNLNPSLFFCFSPSAQVESSQAPITPDILTSLFPRREQAYGSEQTRGRIAWYVFWYATRIRLSCRFWVYLLGMFKCPGILPYMTL